MECYKLIDNTIRNVTYDLRLIYMLFIKLCLSMNPEKLNPVFHTNMKQLNCFQHW